MTGIFLSYSRADREAADAVVRGLRGLGIDVWWDEDMPGLDWQEELERKIHSLVGLVVLWTPTSRNSKNVRDEARLALSSEKLINVLMGEHSPPFPFDRVNGLPLNGWTLHESHGGWTRLVQTIEEHLVEAGLAQPHQFVGAVARRDQAIVDQRQAFLSAETAYADAKAEEAQAEASSSAARTALEAAQDELQRILEMHAGAGIIRAAQAQLDEARAVSEAAAARRGAVAKTLSVAARALPRAKAELARMLDDPQPPSADDPRSPARRTTPAGIRPEPVTAPSAASEVSPAAAKSEPAQARWPAFKAGRREVVAVAAASAAVLLLGLALGLLGRHAGAAAGSNQPAPTNAAASPALASAAAASHLPRPPIFVAPSPASPAPAASIAPSHDDSLLGMTVSTTNVTLRTLKSYPVREGVTIVSLDPSGPAASAGLQTGDAVLSVDDHWTPDRFLFDSAMNDLASGKSIRVEYWRSGFDDPQSTLLTTRPEKAPIRFGG